MAYARSFVAALVLVLSTAPLARATPVIDQQQPLIDASVGGLVIGGTSTQKLAQVVTTGVPGLLAEIRLPVACDPGSNLIVEIQGVSGGRPNGVVLTSQIIPGSSLPKFYY